MAKLVSKVYGEALFEAAVDHGNAIQLMNETAQLEKILEDNPDFDKLMKHPGCFRSDYRCSIRFPASSPAKCCSWTGIINQKYNAPYIPGW